MAQKSPFPPKSMLKNYFDDQIFFLNATIGCNATFEYKFDRKSTLIRGEGGWKGSEGLFPDINDDDCLKRCKLSPVIEVI